MTTIKGTLNGQPMRGIVVNEYLRRNLLHASAIGALAGAKKSLARVKAWKNAPKWLVRSLSGVVIRADAVATEMAAHRDEVRNSSEGRKS